MNKNLRGLMLIVSGLIWVALSTNISEEHRDRSNSVHAFGQHQSGSCTNNSRFVADITIPDGTKVDPGATFIKTWRIRNIGTCTWTTDYSIVYVNGDRIGATASVKLRERVTPGNNVDISVTFTAPSAAGSYVGSWQLRAPNGVKFGTKPYIGVVVVDPLALLKGEIYYGGQGGDGGRCYFNSDTPSFDFDRYWYGVRLATQMSEFRFRGIPLENRIQINLTAPSGMVYSKTVSLTEVYDSEHCGDDIEVYSYGNRSTDPDVTGYFNGRETILFVHSWIPAGTLYGKWTISVISGQEQVRKDFTIGDGELFEPHMSAIPANRQYSPFTAVYYVGWGCYVNIRAGEKVIINGEGFATNKTIPIGVYKWDDENRRGLIVDGFSVLSDNRGRFSVNYTTSTRLSFGSYIIVVPAEAFTPSLDEDVGKGAAVCLEIK